MRSIKSNLESSQSSSPSRGIASCTFFCHHKFWLEFFFVFRVGWEIYAPEREITKKDRKKIINYWVRTAVKKKLDEDWFVSSGGAANENYQRQRKIANLFSNSTLKLKIGILIELFANNFRISFELLLLLIERTSWIYIYRFLSLFPTTLLALKAAAILHEFSKTIFIDWLSRLSTCVCCHFI